MHAVTPQTSTESRQRQHLMRALRKCPTLETAAASIGMSSADASRISQTGEFANDYSKARREGFSQALGHMQIAANAAVTTLWEIMVDPSVSDACRVRAADSLLRRAIETNALAHLEERVTELEQTAAERERLRKQSTSAETPGKQVAA